MLLSDTERDVDWKMEWHFHKKLKAKRDRCLRSKLKDKKVVLDSCKVIVQTAGRARDVPYTIEEPEEDVPEIRGTEWWPVDAQLEEWAAKFPNKELHLNITWTYNEEVQETQACPAGAQNTSNIVGASATANMLRELESQIAAEGEEGATNFWQQIHTIWRCDG